jgi:polysaccharide export outer membrane protein
MLMAMRYYGFIILTFLFASCGKYNLFNGETEKKVSSPGNLKENAKTNAPEKLFATGDKITISVWGHEDLSIGSVHNVYNVSEEYGKWVMINGQGEVMLPQVGKVKLAGLSNREAVLYLEKIYSKFIQNPIINIRVLNNRVTVLGEVRKPGNFLFSSNSLQLAELIGKSEGFTDFARTSRIKIIHEDGSSVLADYTDINTLLDENMIVLPGDVVYVPPAPGKKFDRVSSKLIPLASLITAIVVLLSFTTDNNN